MSNLVRTARVWINFVCQCIWIVHYLLPVRFCLMCYYFGMLEALRLEMQKIKTRKSKALNMIAKIVYACICLREDNLNFNKYS